MQSSIIKNDVHNKFIDLTEWYGSFLTNNKLKNISEYTNYINGSKTQKERYQWKFESIKFRIFTSASPDKEIVKTVSENGGQTILTKYEHPTGSDRVYEAYSNKFTS